MTFCQKLWIFLLPLAALAFSDAVQAQQVRILYYSSSPEIIRTNNRPGLAQVAAVVREEREKSDDVFFIHGGASLGPSVLGALDSGAHMIDVLNLLEPDLMAVGKREFSYKEDQFVLHTMSAGFPFITSNLVQKSDGLPLEGIDATIILDTEEFLIGFIALTSKDAVVQYGAHSLDVLPQESVVRGQAAALRADGADAVILLADTDFENLAKYTADETVDAIFYAHNFDNPVSADTGRTTITEGALDGRLLALTLEKAPQGDGASTLTSTIETIDLHAKEKDPEVLSLIQSYASRLEILLQQEIGVTKNSFNTIRAQVRTKENAFGNLVADAVRTAMNADVALMNSGGIRGNRYYESGQTLTREDIQLELPFNNTVELFEVTGAQLIEALDWGIGCAEQEDGCFLQVSNITMTYDPSQPAGKRVSRLLVGGKPIVSSDSYKLATLNFLAGGGDGFTMLQGSPRLSRTGSGKLLWEVVATYLQGQTSIEPKIEGRLTLSSRRAGR